MRGKKQGEIRAGGPEGKGNFLQHSALQGLRN
jgi:hypothetical protein